MYHEKDFNNTRLPLHMDKDNKSSISTAFPPPRARFYFRLYRQHTELMFQLLNTPYLLVHSLSAAELPFSSRDARAAH